MSHEIQDMMSAVLEELLCVHAKYIDERRACRNAFDEAENLKAQICTQSIKLESALKAVESHRQGIERLKKKNDQLNADVKSLATMFRVLDQGSRIADGDLPAVKELCKKVGYPIEDLNVEVPE